MVIEKNKFRRLIMKETKAAENGSKPASKFDSKGWLITKKIWKYVKMFRGVIFSIPVAVIAIIQAFRNAGRLPETVGMELLATGEFASTISRTSAVLIPLGITALCILLTCISKRTLFPWIISVFSLVLPILIWLTNVYPM
jgi:hypothetical protein